MSVCALQENRMAEVNDLFAKIDDIRRVSSRKLNLSVGY